MELANFVRLSFQIFPLFQINDASGGMLSGESRLECCE